MAEVWIRIEALVAFMKVNKSTVSRAIAAKKYTVREVPGGRGGKGGIRYEVRLDTLPQAAQDKYWKMKEAELDEMIESHKALVKVETGHIPDAAHEITLDGRFLNPQEGEIHHPEMLSEEGDWSLPARPKYIAEKRVLPKPEIRDSDRAIGSAKAGLVQAMRHLGGELGLSDKEACKRLTLTLAAGEGSAALQTLWNTARGGKKDKPLKDGHSLQRWAGQWDEGVAEGEPLKYLVPGRRLGYDWHTVPWAAAVLSRWQHPNKPDMAQVVRTVRKDLMEAGWHEEDIPHYGQARHWLAKLPLRVRERRRNSGAALKALLPYIKRDWSGLQSNDVWVGDGHSFKAKVCHPDHGRPFAPEVTFIIDAASRFIVGWAVSLSENTIAVAEAIGKGMVSHGRPLIYYSDNGAGQTAKFLDADLVGILPRFGVRHETGIPGNPQGRGIIERLWASTLIRLAKEYPTFQGKDVDPDSLKKVVRDIGSARSKQAVPGYVPTWAQFIEDVGGCVKGYNFEHPHKQLGGKTPADSYLEKLAQDSVMPLTEQEAADVFRPEVFRVVQRGWVTVYRNEYFAKGLEDWNGKEVRVLFDFADASKVWVRDMQGRPLATALFEANKKDGFDKPLMQQLAEQRVERAVNRLADQQAEKRLELSSTLEGEVIQAINLREIAQGEAVLAAEAARKPQLDQDKQAELAGDLILKAEAARPKPRTVEDLFAEGEWSEVGGKAKEAPKVVLIQPAQSERPKFNDEESWLVWLYANPVQMTEEDVEDMHRMAALYPDFKQQCLDIFGQLPAKKAAQG